MTGRHTFRPSALRSFASRVGSGQCRGVQPSEAVVGKPLAMLKQLSSAREGAMRNFAAMHVADGAVRFTAPVASEAGSDDDNAVVSAGADGVRREATGAARLASLPLPKRSYGNMEYACRTRDRADYRGSPSFHALWLWCRGPCATDSLNTDLCCMCRRQRSRREF